MNRLQDSLFRPEGEGTSFSACQAGGRADSREHLHPVVIFLYDERLAARHRDPARAVELAVAAALRAERAEEHPARGVVHRDAVVAIVRDEHLAARHRDPARAVELAAAAALRAERAEEPPARGVVHRDAVVVIVRDEHLAARHRDPVRAVELAAAAAPRAERAEEPPARGVVHRDAVVDIVRDEHLAARHRDPARAVELAAAAAPRAERAEEPPARGVVHRDAVVARVRDEHLAARHRDPARKVELAAAAAPRAERAEEPPARGVVHRDAVVARVRDEHLAARHRDPLGGAVKKPTSVGQACSKQMTPLPKESHADVKGEYGLCISKDVSLVANGYSVERSYRTSLRRAEFAVAVAKRAERAAVDACDLGGEKRLEGSGSVAAAQPAHLPAGGLRRLPLRRRCPSLRATCGGRRAAGRRMTSAVAGPPRQQRALLSGVPARRRPAKEFCDCSQSKRVTSEAKVHVHRARAIRSRERCAYFARERCQQHKGADCGIFPRSRHSPPHMHTHKTAESVGSALECGATETPDRASWLTGGAWGVPTPSHELHELHAYRKPQTWPGIFPNFPEPFSWGGGVPPLTTIPTLLEAGGPGPESGSSRICYKTSNPQATRKMPPAPWVAACARRGILRIAADTARKTLNPLADPIPGTCFRTIHLVYERVPLSRERRSLRRGSGSMNPSCPATGIPGMEAWEHVSSEYSDTGSGARCRERVRLLRGRGVFCRGLTARARAVRCVPRSTVAGLPALGPAPRRVGSLAARMRSVAAGSSPRRGAGGAHHAPAAGNRKSRARGGGAAARRPPVRGVVGTGARGICPPGEGEGVGLRPRGRPAPRVDSGPKVRDGFASR
eukprot:gene25807-biopygen24020